jgi:hypothetical protein
MPIIGEFMPQPPVDIGVGRHKPDESQVTDTSADQPA